MKSNIIMLVCLAVLTLTACNRVASENQTITTIDSTEVQPEIVSAQEVRKLSVHNELSKLEDRIIKVASLGSNKIYLRNYLSDSAITFLEKEGYNVKLMNIDLRKELILVENIDYVTSLEYLTLVTWDTR